MSVELLGREPTEVTDTRERDRQQTVGELPHAVAAQRHVGADGHSLAKLELGDRLAGLRDLRLLTGDGCEVADGALDQLGVLRSVSDTHVDDDLRETGDLVDVLVRELLVERREDLRGVAGLEARLCLRVRLGAHQMSFAVSP